ncbi:MAG: hypothetical protein NTW19_16385 [Planctomycetota bacterium]|nr:hypothetical protein [Planctomycetota bacterium]
MNPHRPRRSAGFAAALLGSAAIALLSAGCGGPKPTQDNPDHVKLSDLRSRVTPPPTDPDFASAETLPAQALITRLNIPREVPLTRAWRAVSTEGLDAEAVERWRRNGLRIGTIELSHAGDFVASLPDALEGRSQTRIRAPYAAGIAANEPLTAPVRLSVARGPGVTETSPVGEGRFQLLFTLKDAPGGRVSVEVAPHQFLARSTIEVRTPMDREADGRVFRELGVLATLAPDRALVIGYDAESRPPSPDLEAEEEPETEANPKPAGGAGKDIGNGAAKAGAGDVAPHTPQDMSSDPKARDDRNGVNPPVGEGEATAAPATATTRPATQPAASQPRPRPVRPSSLGDLILTTTRFNTPVHVVYIVGVQPRQKFDADAPATRPR